MLDAPGFTFERDLPLSEDCEGRRRVIAFTGVRSDNTWFTLPMRELLP